MNSFGQSANEENNVLPSTERAPPPEIYRPEISVPGILRGPPEAVPDAAP